jgi:hypothetical protein
LVVGGKGVLVEQHQFRQRMSPEVDCPLAVQ